MSMPLFLTLLFIVSQAVSFFSPSFSFPLSPFLWVPVSFLSVHLLTFASQSLSLDPFLILLSGALFLSVFFFLSFFPTHPVPLTFPLSPHTFTNSVCSCTINLMTVTNDIKVIVQLMHLHGSQ